MRRRALLWGPVLVALGGLALLGFNGWDSWRTEASVAAAVGRLHQVVVATGRVEPVTEVTLANKMPGRIKAVLVKEGDALTIGQPVVRFEDDEYLAQARAAEARLAAAQAMVGRARRGVEAARARWGEVKSGARPQEVERARAELERVRRAWEHAELERGRFKRLVDNGYIARSQYDAAEAEAAMAHSRVRAAEETLSLTLAGPKSEAVEAAWAHVQEAEAEHTRVQSELARAGAELEYARVLLRNTVVESTVNGKVIRKLVEPGEGMDVGVPLLIVGDVHKTLVKVEVDETDVGKLALGQRVEVTADAYPGRIFPGTVIEIGQAVGKRRVRPDAPTKIQDMKVLESKVELTEGGADLKLGMTVDVRIIVIDKARALMIPKRVVPPGSTEASVRVVGPTGIEPRRIRLGASDDVNVEIVAGLSAGERVVLSGRTP